MVNDVKIIKIIKFQIVATAVVALAGYAAYQYFLDDEAKAQMKQLYATMGKSYLQLSNLVNERIGTIMDEEVVAQNRAQVRTAWENLGF